jgi:hypothetical protein
MWLIGVVMWPDGRVKVIAQRLIMPIKLQVLRQRCKENISKTTSDEMFLQILTKVKIQKICGFM